MYCWVGGICKQGEMGSAISKARAGACVCTEHTQRGVARLLSREAEKCLLCSHQSSSGHERSLAQEITGVQAQLLPILPKKKITHKKCRSRNEAVETKYPGGLHQGNAVIDRTDSPAQPRSPLPSPKLQQDPFRSSFLGLPTIRTDRPTMPVPPCVAGPRAC